MVAANVSFIEKTGNLGYQNCCAKSWIEVLSWKIEIVEASLKNSVVTQDIPVIPTPSALQITMGMQRAHSPLPFPPLGHTLRVTYLGGLCFQMAPRWGILTHIVADRPLKITGVKQIFWETTSTSYSGLCSPLSSVILRLWILRELIWLPKTASGIRLILQSQSWIWGRHLLRLGDANWCSGIRTFFWVLCCETGRSVTKGNRKVLRAALQSKF